MESRTLKQNIKIIKERVQLINEKLGTKFHANYDEVWKCWTMYEIGKDGEHCRNNIGFDAGKSMDEMYGYTDGFFRMFDYLRYNDTKNVKW